MVEHNKSHPEYYPDCVVVDLNAGDGHFSGNVEAIRAAWLLGAREQVEEQVSDAADEPRAKWGAHHRVRFATARLPISKNAHIVSL